MDEYPVIVPSGQSIRDANTTISSCRGLENDMNGVLSNVARYLTPVAKQAIGDLTEVSPLGETPRHESHPNLLPTFGYGFHDDNDNDDNHDDGYIMEEDVGEPHSKSLVMTTVSRALRLFSSLQIFNHLRAQEVCSSIDETNMPVSLLKYYVTNGDESSIQVLLNHWIQKDKAEDHQQDFLHRHVNARYHKEGGKTVLHIAIQQGHVGVVRRLLFDGQADMTVADNNGYTALHTAIDANQVVLAHLLLDHAEGKQQATYKKYEDEAASMTPLTSSTSSCSSSSSSYKSSSSMSTSSLSFSSFISSSSSPSSSSSSSIFGLGINSVTTTTGLTVIKMALKRAGSSPSWRKLVQRLVMNHGGNDDRDNNIPTSTVDLQYGTNLHCAIEEGAGISIVQLLLEHDGSLIMMENIPRNLDGATPLHLAVRSGQFLIVKALVERNMGFGGGGGGGGSKFRYGNTTSDSTCALQSRRVINYHNSILCRLDHNSHTPLMVARQLRQTVSHPAAAEAAAGRQGIASLSYYWDDVQMMMHCHYPNVQLNLIISFLEGCEAALLG